MGMEDQKLAKTLDGQVMSGVSELWQALAEGGPQGRRRAAVLSLGLVSMARGALLETKKAAQAPRSHPPWLDVARAAIARFVDDKPDRNLLFGTVFFNTDPGAEHRLDLLVSASVAPAGWYENRAFAAGVAAGDIRVRPGLSAFP